MNATELIGQQAATAADDKWRVRELAIVLRFMLVAANYSERRIASLTQADVVEFLTRYSRIGTTAQAMFGDTAVVDDVRTDAMCRVRLADRFQPVDANTWYEGIR